MQQSTRVTAAAALLNMQGELVGINSAKYADSAVEGMGYAIPISKAQPILENLMNRQTRDKVEDDSKASISWGDFCRSFDGSNPDV